ncbi:MAG: hypothetical protein ACYC4D_04515 [Thermoleophilia bacterium]
MGVRTLAQLPDGKHGEKLAPGIPDESIVIAALFHDLGKVGYPGNRSSAQWHL